MDLYGYAREEAVGKTSTDLGLICDPEGRAQLLADLQQQESTRNLESTFYTKSGTARTVLSNMDVITLGGKRYLLSTMQDITERKRAEEALRESEEKYRRIVDTANEGIWIVDNQACTRFVNQKMADLLGYTSEEMMGRNAFDFVFDEDKPKVTVTWDETQQGIPRQIEFRYKRKDGSPLWVLVSNTPYFENGEFAGVLGMFTDITERKRMEEALRESAERFRVPLQNSPVNVSTQGLDLRYTWQYNPQLGYSVDQVVGKTDFDMLPPETARHVTELKRRAIANNSSVREEVSTTYQNTTLYYDFTVEPLRDPEGNVIGVNNIVVDITERKRAEDTLRERDEQLRNLIARSKDGIIITDEAGRITTWNQGMEDITGLAATDALGMPAWEIQSRLVDAEWAGPEYRTRYRETWDRVLQEGLYQYSNRLLDVQIRTTQGDVKYIQQSFFTTPTNRGFHVGSILRDMTRQRRSEEQLKKTIEDLRRSNDDLERFAYISSHDLQEPIRTMVTFTQLLERRYKGRLDPDADEYIRYLVTGGKRMQALVQDLLEFSRVNTTGGEFRPTNTTAIVEDSIAVLNSKAQENGATVTYDPLPRVMADATQLQQVFENLISNAIKFRKPNVPPEIHISAKKQEDMVQFSVADNGIGIEPQYYDRIFVIFQRLHGMDQYEGTGIGLAIVKRIIDRHGGRIRVESEPGKGSTFHFTIPLAKPT